MAWQVTQLAVPMPHDLPSSELLALARWMLRVLLTTNPGDAHPSLP